MGTSHYDCVTTTRRFMITHKLRVKYVKVRAVQYKTDVTVLWFIWLTLKKSAMGKRRVQIRNTKTNTE